MPLLLRLLGAEAKDQFPLHLRDYPDYRQFDLPILVLVMWAVVASNGLRESPMLNAVCAITM